MNKNDSIKISAHIGRAIAESAPYIEYSNEDIIRSKQDYTPEELSALEKSGYLDNDFEKFFVIREFCNSLGIDEIPGRYLRRLFMLAKKLDADEFMADSYISSIKFDDVRRGNILLTTAEYVRGEIFQYDMPEITDDMIVPRLGFFTKPVKFPTLYEGVVPWVSVCPSEINSMSEQMKLARGRVLVLGLGLGYFPYIISSKKCVESITIVELSEDVISVFKDALLPHFTYANKISIVHQDATEYLGTIGENDFDFCFADIWEGVEDGSRYYNQIKPFEKRLPKTEFTYWIENEIKAYLEQ